MAIKKIKFLHVRLIPCLEAIMKQNTAFYQSDLHEDAKMLKRAAAEKDRNKRVMLWFSRECGTECFLERDVFLRGSRANITWMYYAEQKSERFLAYAIEVTGIENEYVMGNLYQLDFAEICERIAAKALPANQTMLRYERLTFRIPSKERPPVNAEKTYGKLLDITLIPDDEQALQELLNNEKRLRSGNREADREEDFYLHIQHLHRYLIRWEEKKLINGFNKEMAEGKTRIAVELSPGFRHLVSMKDIQQMVNSLPNGYSASLQEEDGRLYAVYQGNKNPK